MTPEEIQTASVDQTWGQGRGEQGAGRPTKDHAARPDDRALAMCSTATILNAEEAEPLWQDIQRTLRRHPGMPRTYLRRLYRDRTCQRCIPDTTLNAIIDYAWTRP